MPFLWLCSSARLHISNTEDANLYAHLPFSLSAALELYTHRLGTMAPFLSHQRASSHQMRHSSYREMPQAKRKAASPQARARPKRMDLFSISCIQVEPSP